MSMRERIIQWVDTDWRDATPGWKDSRNRGERHMLYDRIDDVQELDIVAGGG